jgi:hypothetical protein
MPRPKKEEPIDTIELSWHIKDIQWLYESYDEYNFQMTDEEARDILSIILSNHDASIGVNWDVIGYYIDEWISEKEAEAEEKDG